VPGIRRNHHCIINFANWNRDKRPGIRSVTQLTLAVFSPTFYGFVGKHGAAMQIPHPNRYGISDIADGDRNIGRVVTAIAQLAATAVTPTLYRAIR
jgi:hypothetical protein